MNTQARVESALISRRDIFTSFSCQVYFDINRKPVHSDKFWDHISLFLSVEIKDKFPA